jgi:hypothetical protein
MTTTNGYVPPSSAEIQGRQNDDDALRLLIAQRRLHSRAKIWQNLRWIGMVLIGLAAPAISVIWPQLAVVMGAIAGAWIFLGRTGLAWLESRLSRKGAAVQEQFDLYVFAMPRIAARSDLPSAEEISKLAGPDGQIGPTAATNGLIDWYPIKDGDPGPVVVAVCQRSNAAYSDSLLRAMLKFWGISSIVWAIILVVASTMANLSLQVFLVGVFLPVLPAALDVVEYSVGIRRAARDRKDLAASIEDRLMRSSRRAIKGQELLVWQERLFDLRRSTPQVPDWLYRITRRGNEAAMKSAADQLSRRAARPGL